MAEANVELDEVEIVETFIATELERLNYDALVDQVRIPDAVIADWYKRATGDRNVGTIWASLSWLGVQVESAGLIL